MTSEENDDLASSLSPTSAMSLPERHRNRSLSGPGSGHSSNNNNPNSVNQCCKVSSTLPPGSRLEPTVRSSHRCRRQSGGDVCVNSNTNTNKSGGSGSASGGATSTLFDSFRPRSKSDSKGKRPNFIFSLRNSVHMPWTGGDKKSSASSSASRHSHSGTSCPVTPNQLDPCSLLGAERPRSRSGSGGSVNGPVSRVMDMFRSRSHSVVVAGESRGSIKKFSGSGIPSSALLRRHSVDPEARRRANVGNQRSLDFYSESTHQNHLYLFRDPRDSRGGSLYGSNDPICDRLDFEELEENENLLYVKFFKFYRCYDLIPISAKLVVFDTQLLVKKAFYALVSNGVRAAPLWDSTKQGFVGMLTITDFINILRNYYKSSAAKMDELEEQKLEAWRNVLKDNARPIITIEPDACLLDAIKALIHNRVHRLPVIDPETGNVIYVLTHKRILKFLFAYFNDLPSPTYLNSTIKELNIGTYENIAVTTMETPLIKALHLFCEKRVSALPVVDEKGRVVDIYAKFDVINLAAEKIYSNLDITVKKALEHREHYFEGVITCKASDTLLVVLDKIFKNEVHRLVIVDDQDLVVGIVSLSDILSFLALKPLALERQEKKTENSDTLVEDSVKEAAEEEHSAQEAQEAENEEFDEATNYDQEEN